MKMKKLFAAVLAAALLCAGLAGCGASGAEDDPSAAGGSIGSVIGYPPQEISGVIQWGAGGGTDCVRDLYGWAKGKAGL